MRGTGADQIPSGEVGDTLPWGLRLVDGTCNNIVAGKTTSAPPTRSSPAWSPSRSSRRSRRPGRADRARGTGADQLHPDLRHRHRQPAARHQQPGRRPDATNPAAVDAAGESPEVTPSGSFFIPNTAPDVGLSAPFNSWFTLFGQFFDHGLDLVTKNGAQGTVFVPLNADDPLHSTAPGALNFMTLTRAQHSGDHEAINQTTPWVDQSQTYSSHPSHQVVPAQVRRRRPRLQRRDPDRLMATGGLVTGAGGGMATWADVKAQAAPCSASR